MKTKLFNKLLKLAAFMPAMALAQDANLTLDGFNSYYNTYSNSTKNITGIVIEVGADGTNSNNYISSDFQVSLYLLTCDVSGQVTSSSPIIIATYTVFGNSLHQMGTYTFSNQTVDLSQVSGLTDGMYRMGAWVNSDPNGTGIGDPPDSQNDNAGLLMSSGGTSSSSVINFSSASGIKMYEADKHLSVYPVPANTNIDVKLSLEKAGSVNFEIYNATGEKVFSQAGQDLAAGDHTQQINVSTLPNGIYFLYVRTQEGILSKRFVVNR